MSCVRKLYKDKGISDEIAETIIQSWRPNAKCKYDTYRKQWLQFFSQGMCDPMCPTLVTVLEFLYVLRKRNLFLIVPEVFSLHLPQLKDMIQVNTPWYAGT